MPTLGVVVCSVSSFHLDIVRGASRHGLSLGWQIRVCQEQLRLPDAGLRDLIARHPADAYIVQGIDHAPLTAAFAATGAALVEVTARSPGYLGPMVSVDHRALGRAAAQHLIERGFRSFVYIGWRDSYWSVGRLMGYQEALADAGHAPATFFINRASLAERGWTGSDWSTPFIAFLHGLPRPLAVVGQDDVLAAKVARVCHAHGVRVAEDVAVLGIDNDAFICETVLPPLSSVRSTGIAIGIEAARLAERLLAGERVPGDDLLLPALGVEQRRSTDITAVDDAALASALRFLRDRWREPTVLAALPAAAGVSRRTLERRFARQFGRSPRDELRRLRIDHARELLLDTAGEVGAIARECGFASVSAFCRSFRQATGQSPRMVRERHRCGRRPPPHR